MNRYMRGYSAFELNAKGVREFEPKFNAEGVREFRAQV
jgi:hypothetical protein